MAEYKFLDDLAKFGNSTITAMSGMQRQVRKWAAEQFDYMIEGMDLVSRKELDAHKAKIEELEARLAKLEGTAEKPAKKTKKA